MIAPVPTQIPKLSPSTRPTAHFSLPQPAPTTYCPLFFVSSRRLHHVVSISLPFSAASAYFASPRGCSVHHSRCSHVRTLQHTKLFYLQELAASLSSLCALFCARSLCFQSFAASFCKTPGVGGLRFHPHASSLELPAMLNSACMHPAIPHLLELQTVDQHIAKLRGELDSFPKRIREADLKLTGARNALAAAREANTHGLTERKKFELDVQQWKERARKYREQSGAVKTNEAYKALQHEITNAEAEVAKAEDRQLEVMMAGEESERRLKVAETALKQAEQSIAVERKEIETQQGARKKDLEAALAERERALSPVPEDLRELYARIAKRHHGVALAEARDGQCRGCGMRVLPHILQQLLKDDSDELFRCESCGLILYSLEPIPAPNPENSSGSAASSASNSS